VLDPAPIDTLVERDEPPCEGASVGVRALIACEQADYVRAEAFARQSLRLAHGDAWLEGHGLCFLERAASGVARSKKRGSPSKQATRSPSVKVNHHT
jgi:hypothetical protein